MYDIFISYARRDGTPLARQLAHDLREAQLKVFWDQDSIPPGVNWEDTLDAALEAATHILVVLTPMSVKSEEVTAEWRPMLGKGKNVIPLLYQSCEIPRRLSMRQYIDFQEDTRYPIALAEVISTISNFSGAEITLDISGEELLQRAQAYFDSGQPDLAAKDYLAALRDPDVEIRARAARRIGKVRSLAHLPALVDSLVRETHIEVKLFLFPIIRGMAGGADWAAVMPDLGVQIIQFLAAPEPELRQEAIRVLAYGQMKEFIPRIADHLVKDAAEVVRVQAALSLGRLKDAEATPMLVKGLSDSSSEVRKAVISALQVHSDPRGVIALEPIGRGDKDPEVRAAAREALAEIRRKQA